MSVISELGEGGKRSEVEDHPWLFIKFEASSHPVSPKGERYLKSGKGYVDLLALLQIRRNQRDMCQAYI